MARKCGNVVWDLEGDKSLGQVTLGQRYSAPGITATELHGDLDQWARATRRCFRKTSFHIFSIKDLIVDLT